MLWFGLVRIFYLESIALAQCQWDGRVKICLDWKLEVTFSFGQYWLSREKNACWLTLQSFFRGQVSHHRLHFYNFSFSYTHSDNADILLADIYFCERVKYSLCFFFHIKKVVRPHAIIKQLVIRTSFIFQFPCNWQYQYLMHCCERKTTNNGSKKAKKL